ncbi:MAG: type VI secretion system ATPase TssH [Isosphaeraceae bacterium]|nr:type VI secretion system ATPase TssH [Isosphaeraceae bacterium]
MPLDSGALIKKLNKSCLDALQGAAGLCLSRTNYSVELEHWLTKLMEVQGGDLARIFKQFEVDPSAVLRELTKAIDGLKTGNGRTPTLSPQIDAAIREAWVLASVQFQESSIRSGVLLLAMLSDERLGRLVRESSRELGKINADALSAGLAKIVAGSIEEESPAGSAAAQAGTGDPGRPAGASKTPSLDQFTINLTEKAQKGQIDPVLGRDAEIRQMVDILIRRRQNNPILTGEAGVGKTAVVEGFALRVAQGDVPPVLKNVHVRTLDLTLLQAGAGVKGEFENRLKKVIEEVKSSPIPIILFIDEAHTMIGAGGQAGQNDAANLLKPALARGELRTIAATTFAEYKQYFEKDAALARRFQEVKVEEPSVTSAVRMMRGVVGMLEKHHGVRILDEAVESSVTMSARYIQGRQLPDKSVSLLDTACARVKIGQNSTPPAVEDAQRRIQNLEVELGILERESAVGAPHGDRIAAVRADLESTRVELAELQARWEKEAAIVKDLQAIRESLEQLHAADKAAKAETPSPAIAEKTKELEAKTAELRALQGEKPLMQVCVDAQTIAEVISGWTGVPVGRMLSDEIHTVLNLKAKMEERIVGQAAALEVLTQRLWTARAGLTDPRKPIGVFMLVGPSGVGKTETALALADLLYGGEKNLITINMSEYKDSSSISNLKGSAKGLVGYGEGGVLTEAVRKRPYSVVLLDECEKAHYDVMELFFQVFDKGTLEDTDGRVIDFKNTVILLTSNAGTDLIAKLCSDPDTCPDAAALAEALRPELLKHFKPAFLGRLNVVPYFPISDPILRMIIKLQLGRVSKRIRETHKAEFTYQEALIEAIASRCREVESGARNVESIINKTMLPEISEHVLTRMAEGKAISAISIGVDDKGEYTYVIE